MALLTLLMVCNSFRLTRIEMETRIVFKKDNQRCGAILQHEMKKIAVLIFAPPVAIYILQYV